MADALFDQILPVFGAAEESLYGEPFDYQPMRVPPNGRPVVDNTRAAIPGLIGMWLDPPTVVTAGVTSIYTGDSPRVMLTLSRFAAPPREGDYFTRAADGITYVAENPKFDGFGRVTFELKEAGE